MSIKKVARRALHHTVHGRAVPAKPKPTSDAVWAIISIVSFPTVALSLTAMGWRTYLSFIMACLVTLAILLIEALVRGKIWIFQKNYQHIFDHQETPFRILVVTGGVLLVLETLLLIQFFQNPAMDGYILNMVARKECHDPQAPLARLICPIFERSVTNRQDFALTYSLETAAKAHLMPSYLAGSCLVLPLYQSSLSGQATLDVKFFTYCQIWQATTCRTASVGDLAIITAQMSKNSQGFYVPTTWQEERRSKEYQEIMGDKNLLQSIERQLNARCLDALKLQN